MNRYIISNLRVYDGLIATMEIENMINIVRQSEGTFDPFMLPRINARLHDDWNLKLKQFFIDWTKNLLREDFDDMNSTVSKIYDPNYKKP
jgi:hypothetical protein